MLIVGRPVFRCVFAGAGTSPPNLPSPGSQTPDKPAANLRRLTCSVRRGLLRYFDRSPVLKTTCLSKRKSPAQSP
eukprot:4321475-Heterocapsa_arctica.AAC.1